MGLMLKVLHQQPLMHMSYRGFDALAGSCRAAFKAWDDSIDDFRSLLRTMTLRKKDGTTTASALPVCCAAQSNKAFKACIHHGRPNTCVLLDVLTTRAPNIAGWAADWGQV